ncbi:hypothetical protein KL907_002533 [Ogataea polymorpha]|nr:hypothetical protein KL937_004877 [Ogataea polymorpha]KAG7906893.1 hypothetical protein KL907_002533 [Ogataea polymorpha]KAG7931856.1 hypothetical protein KL904_004897 [Ogataea polymorpha]
MSEEKVSPLQNPELLPVLNNLKSLRKINAQVCIRITPTDQSPYFGEPYKSIESRVNPFANNGRAAYAKFRPGLGYGHLDESAGLIVTINFNETGQLVFLFPQYQ